MNIFISLPSNTHEGSSEITFIMKIQFQYSTKTLSCNIWNWPIKLFLSFRIQYWYWYHGEKEKDREDKQHREWHIIWICSCSVSMCDESILIWMPIENQKALTCSPYLLCMRRVEIKSQDDNSRWIAKWINDYKKRPRCHMHKHINTSLLDEFHFEENLIECTMQKEKKTK